MMTSIKGVKAKQAIEYLAYIKAFVMPYSN